MFPKGVPRAIRVGEDDMAKLPALDFTVTDMSLRMRYKKFEAP